jgi:hypothetical protein
MTEKRIFSISVLLGLFVGTLVGAVVAALTTKLNLHLDSGAVVGFFLLFCVIYGALGLVLGGVGAAVLLLVAKRSPRGRGFVSILFEGLGALSKGVVFGGWVSVFGALFLFALVARRELPFEPRPTIPRPETEPFPLVLLCIDGADLDLIQSMVEAGDLPTFRRLLRRGTWGKLKTLRPTLSPIIWTTLITGQPAELHGIHDFVHFRLPGIGGPVFHFPRRSGFAHKLFPRLEKMPGSDFLRAPNTSDLRRVRALWEIVGEHFSVGVYRWLMTWPVEKVNGFMVAGGLYAGPGNWHPGAKKWLRRTRRDSPEALQTRHLHPPEVWAEIPPVRQRKIRRKQLLAYLASEYQQEATKLKGPSFKLIRRGIEDATLDELVALSKKYRPRFTVANFYTVDAFQHRFGAAHTQGGRFSEAVRERYRFTDRRLGLYLATLEPETNVLIVSDHGFDFALEHHQDAPPGIFLAAGPAFSRHRQVEGLSVFDIAPLCLHLLGLPLAGDMPGTVSGKYREALKPRYLKKHPVGSIPTYGSRQMGETPGEELDENLKKELESLGYL